MFFKAADIAHLTDARYFAAMGASWLGFAVPMPGEEGAAAAYARLREMNSWVEGPEPVAELARRPTEAEAEEIVLSTGIKALQWPAGFGAVEALHLPPGSVHFAFFSFPASLCASDFLRDLRRQLEGHVAFAKHLVLRLEGALSAEACSLLPTLFEGLPLILELDWTPELLRRMADSAAIEAVQFRGGEEEAPGVKSYDELEELMELL